MALPFASKANDFASLLFRREGSPARPTSAIPYSPLSIRHSILDGEEREGMSTYANVVFQWRDSRWSGQCWTRAMFAVSHRLNRNSPDFVRKIEWTPNSVLLLRSGCCTPVRCREWEMGVHFNGYRPHNDDIKWGCWRQVGRPTTAFRVPPL